MEMISKSPLDFNPGVHFLYPSHIFIFTQLPALILPVNK